MPSFLKKSILLAYCWFGIVPDDVRVGPLKKALKRSGFGWPITLRKEACESAKKEKIRVSAVCLGNAIPLSVHEKHINSKSSFSNIF